MQEKDNNGAADSVNLTGENSNNITENVNANEAAQNSESGDDNIDISSNVSNKGLKKKKRKKMSVKKKVIMIVSIVLASCIVLGISGYALMYFKPFHKTGETTPLEIQTPKEVKADSYNVLLCGIDYEVGTERGHLTDIQMYLHIDAKNNKISILQIPRDTFIGLDEGIWTGKINGIYGRSTEGGRKNGIIGLEEYINSAYKLPVDFYATVTMTTFKKVIDEIGGVEMDVPFTIEQDGVVVEEGKQTLTGAQAEAFVRKRKSHGTGTQYYDGSDTKRIKMQRKFMAALIKKFKKLPLDKVYAAVKTAMPDVDSDLNIGNIKDIIGVVYNMPMKNMIIDMLPGEDLRYSENNQWVYTLHKQAVADLLNEKFRTYAKAVPAEELDFEELKNSETYLDHTVDNMQDLLKKDVTPGTDKSVSSAASSNASSN